MSSRPPKRSITPYAPFADPPPSPATEPPPTESAPAPRPPAFTEEILDALDRVEQSITENVKRALQALGTLVIAKHAETQARLDAHARELGTLREAVERGGVILPPPPEGL